MADGREIEHDQSWSELILAVASKLVHLPLIVEPEVNHWLAEALHLVEDVLLEIDESEHFKAILTNFHGLRIGNAILFRGVLRDKHFLNFAAVLEVDIRLLVGQEAGRLLAEDVLAYLKL